MATMLVILTVATAFVALGLCAAREVGLVEMFLPQEESPEWIWWAMGHGVGGAPHICLGRHGVAAGKGESLGELTIVRRPP